MSENDILEYLFPSEINYVLWRPITVIGLPSSGKTNFSLYIAKLVRDRYPGDVNVVYTNNLRVAIDRLDDRLVQVLIIDDAIRHQGSFTGIRDRELAFNPLT